MKNFNIKNFKWTDWFAYFVFGVVLLLILFFLGYLISDAAFFRDNPNATNYYVALGTLLLALVTGLLAFLIWIAIKNSKHLEDKAYKAKILAEINIWAKQGFNYINTNLPDTTPERIKENRMLLTPVYTERVGINSLARSFGREFHKVVENAARNLEDYFCYFDEGRKTAGNINELPSICKDSFLDVFRAVANIRTGEKV